ncbi:MAG: hypothetical protein KatS3mg105_2717 [Gemmatales bacterium]|nr:MAG: hypothetical protein KatS3mg105_2717 [Gemmatales bacterium]
MNIQLVAMSLTVAAVVTGTATAQQLRPKPVYPQPTLPLTRTVTPLVQPVMPLIPSQSIPQQPRIPYPTPLPQPVYPPVIQRPLRASDLEDLIECRIERYFGRYVDDVDVDVNYRRGCVEIEVEVCHPYIVPSLQQFVYAMPELRGLRIVFDIDYDD